MSLPESEIRKLQNNTTPKQTQPTTKQYIHFYNISAVPIQTTSWANTDQHIHPSPSNKIVNRQNPLLCVRSSRLKERNNWTKQHFIMRRGVRNSLHIGRLAISKGPAIRNGKCFWSVFVCVFCKTSLHKLYMVDMLTQFVHGTAAVSGRFIRPLAAGRCFCFRQSRARACAFKLCARTLQNVIKHFARFNLQSQALRCDHFPPSHLG